MPIMTATRSMVSRASAGWRAHHVSVLAILVLRTVRFASEIGRSLRHFFEGSNSQGARHVVSQPRVCGGGNGQESGGMLVQMTVEQDCWSCS